MTTFSTTLQGDQLFPVTPIDSTIVAPTISASISIQDEFPSFASPLTTTLLGHPRDVIGARNRKFFGGFQSLGLGDDFFDDVYVLPVSIDVGIILSVVIVEVEVYSSWRSGDVSWTAYDDSSAGAGVTLSNPLPPPPTVVIGPLSGIVHDLTIDPIGPPSIAGTLEFTMTDPLGGPVARSIPISGQRSVVFPFLPESPILEILEWVTMIRRASNGQEQRAALREVPRSTYDLAYVTEGDERRRLDSALFDGQGRVYGVPVWFESVDLVNDIAINDTVITVTNTDCSTFAEEQVAVAWDGYDNFEALQIASFTSTTVTFSSPFTKAFTAGALVIPVRTAVLLEAVAQDRWRVNLQRTAAKFVVTDNGVDLSDVSAFSSYTPASGVARVLLDDDNFVDGATIREQWRRLIVAIDSRVSFPEIFTNQSVSKRASQKGFFTRSRQELWDMRRLLHALKGRRTAFYLPTFAEDLEAISNIASADQAITVADIDYTNLIQRRQPRDLLRVVATDGTKSTPKLITGSSKPSPGEELISISPDTVGITVAVENVDRVEYIEKSRIDTDRIMIRHLDSAGKSMSTFPVVSVLEGDL
jgi:hypothetical protein